jgi:Ca2+-binding EF-hand superfamily protein
LERSLPELRVETPPLVSVQVRLRNAYHDNLMKVMSVMQRYDSDKSGSIELTEFVMMVRELTGSPFAHDAEVHALFKQLDRDNSGAASFAELCVHEPQECGNRGQGAEVSKRSLAVYPEARRLRRSRSR